MGATADAEDNLALSRQLNGVGGARGVALQLVCPGLLRL